MTHIEFKKTLLSWFGGSMSFCSQPKFVLYHATIMGHNMCFVFICCFLPLVVVEKCYEIGYHRYQLWVCMQQLRENSECFNIFIWPLSPPHLLLISLPKASLTHATVCQPSWIWFLFIKGHNKDIHAFSRRIGIDRFLKDLL